MKENIIYNQDGTVAQVIPSRAPTLLDVVNDELSRLDAIICHKSEYYNPNGGVSESDKAEAQTQRKALQEALVKALTLSHTTTVWLKDDIQLEDVKC